MSCKQAWSLNVELEVCDTEFHAAALSLRDWFYFALQAVRGFHPTLPFLRRPQLPLASLKERRWTHDQVYSFLRVSLRVGTESVLGALRGIVLFRPIPCVKMSERC